MTRDDIIRMAREIGLKLRENNNEIYSPDCDGIHIDEMQHFAQLIEAHVRGEVFKPDWDNYRQGLIDGAIAEREAILKMCEPPEHSHQHVHTFKNLIRARGSA